MIAQDFPEQDIYDKVTNCRNNGRNQQTFGIHDPDKDTIEKEGSNTGKGYGHSPIKIGAGSCDDIPVTGQQTQEGFPANGIKKSKKKHDDKTELEETPDHILECLPVLRTIIFSA